MTNSIEAPLNPVKAENLLNLSVGSPIPGSETGLSCTCTITLLPIGRSHWQVYSNRDHSLGE
jgi:hypothetical protein